MYPDQRRRHFLAMVSGAAAACLVGKAQAASSGDVEVIRTYYQGLLGLMRQARGLTVKERYQRLSPIVSRAFDLASMTKAAVGPGWANLGGEQGKVQAAFSRLLIASYAKNITDFGGETFNVEDATEQRAGGTVVKTTISRIGGLPTRIDYLMRGGKVVDLYFNGAVSEIASRRAEFAPILAIGGSKALLAALEQRGSTLLNDA